MTTPLKRSTGSRDFKKHGPARYGYEIVSSTSSDDGASPVALSNDKQQATALDSQDEPIRRRSIWAIIAMLFKSLLKIAFSPILITRWLFKRCKHNLTVFLYGKHPSLTYFKILPSIVLLGSFGRRPLTTFKLATKKGPQHIFGKVPFDVSVGIIIAVIVSALIDITVQSIQIYKERYAEPKSHAHRLRIATFNQDEVHALSHDPEEQAFQKTLEELEDEFRTTVLGIKATIIRLQNEEAIRTYIESLLDEPGHRVKCEKINPNILASALKQTDLDNDSYFKAVKSALTEPKDKSSFKTDHPWMQITLDFSEHFKKLAIFPLRALGLMLTFGVGFGIGTWAAVGAVFVTALIIIGIDACCEHFKDQEKKHIQTHGQHREITAHDNLFMRSLDYRLKTTSKNDKKRFSSLCTTPTEGLASSTTSPIMWNYPGKDTAPVDSQPPRKVTLQPINTNDDARYDAMGGRASPPRGPSPF